MITEEEEGRKEGRRNEPLGSGVGVSVSVEIFEDPRDGFEEADNTGLNLF